MAGFKKPGFYILCDVINHRCTVLGVYTESDSGGWHEVLHPPAKNAFCFTLRREKRANWISDPCHLRHHS